MTKNCQNCKQEFRIVPEDLAFYQKIDVPPPTFCFSCRLQRRMSWRNERALYKRQCDLCNKSIFAMYPKEASFPVYCKDCWWSDRWDPLEYGRNYDFSRNFFDQFFDLLHAVPRIALQVENVVNCDYANQILDCKNCYLIASGLGNQDCMYSYRLLHARNILDSYAVVKCENVYEGAMGRESSNIFYCQGFADSRDLYFCDEPRGAQNCFMGVNLRRASNVFRGEQLSRDEYLRRLEKLELGSYRLIESFREEFRGMIKKSLRPHGTFKNVIDTTGNALANTKNCRSVFHSTDLENCSYCFLVDRAKDSRDVNNGGHIMELMYEMNTTGARAFNSKFCNDAWPEVMNLTYCDSSRSGAKDLFGCISVRGKQYCILNKQYSKSEYEKMVGRIAAHMDEVTYRDKAGRLYKYGEFFPAELSPFPYNDSMAQDFFPLSQGEAEAQGWNWNAKTEKNVALDLSAAQLPDRIQDTPDDILNKIIGCSDAGKCNHRCTIGFRIVPDELSFYRRFRIPLPRLCPNCRHYRRLADRNPLRLWQRQCACQGQTAGEYKNTAAHFHGDSPCPNKFETSYAPDRPEIVYCEQCYNAEVA